jgi:hypothetical protein
VQAQERAVANAEAAKDTECKSGVAWKCRSREDKVAEESAKLIALQKNRGPSETVEKLVEQIDAESDKLAALGHVPETADATAAQLAHILGSLWNLTPDSVSSNRPAYTAFVIELMGAGMPLVLFLTFADAITAPVPVQAPRPVRLARTRAPRSKPEAIEEMQPDPLVMLPASVRKPIAKGNGGKASTDTSHLTLWWSECVVEGEGSRFQAKVFRQSYEGWCKVRGIKPVGPNPFGKFIVGEIGDDAKETERGYTFYHGYKLKLAALQRVG